MEEEISLSEICSILRQRVGRIIIWSLLGLLLTGLYTFFLVTPTYQSTSKIVVNQTQNAEQAITNGRLDFAKIQPILFVMDNTGYWKLGEQFAKAWNGEIVRHLE